MTQDNASPLYRSGMAMHATGFGIMLALAVCPFVVAGLPLASQNRALEQLIDKNTRLLELAPKVEERHQTLLQEAAAQNKRRSEVFERIPEQADKARFLAQLTELANACSMRIDDFRPGNVEHRSTYSQQEIAIKAAGTYPQLCKFLAGLETLPRYSRISSARVELINADQEQLDIQLNLRIFFGSRPK